MTKHLLHITRTCFIFGLFVMMTSCEMPGAQVAGVGTEMLGVQVAGVNAELPPPPLSAWIAAPLFGEEAPPGTLIKVVGHVDPSVGQPILYINGENSGLPSAMMLNKTPPAYEWEWIPEQTGIYDLRIGDADSPLSSVVQVTISGEMVFSAEFWADQTTLKPGECTRLQWKTENAQKVQVQGVVVEPQGVQGICPQNDELHILQVQYKDNHVEEYTTHITVLVDTPTPTSTLNTTPTPTPTITPTPTRTRWYVPPVKKTTVPEPSDHTSVLSRRYVALQLP